jgi:K+-sensing histidine kinase KdpD
MAALLREHQRPVAGGEIDTIRALLHDLRQPLAAIMLLSGAEGGDVERKMQGISGQARWLAELVETVLSDAAADDVISTDVAELASRAVERARATSACEITLEAPDESESAEAWARPVALSRALACVLDNAVRAAGDDGHVTVGVHSDVEGVHLRVVDDGPGLGRVASRTSLGLTTTRAMVAACRGSFELAPGRDGGAVADICLMHTGLAAVAS